MSERDTQVPEAAQQRTVLASMVQLYVMFGIKCGLAPEAMYAAAGISEAQVAVPSAHVPYRWLWLVRDHVLRQFPDRPLGLALGHFFTMDQYGYMGQAMKHAASPRAAIALWNQLVMVMHRGVPDPPRLDDEGPFMRWSMPVLLEEPSESFESTFVATTIALRTLTGCAHLAPHAVEFTRCRREFLPAYEAFFGATVRTGQPRDAMVFTCDVLDLPLAHADAQTSARFVAYFEAQTAAQGDPLVAALERVVEAELRDGRLTQARVARQLGMTSRTLQRRCRERGVSYRDLVERVRRTTALALLRDRSRNVNEVALAVGYDASSFNRAFRSWTGVSPSVYRKHALTAARS